MPSSSPMACFPLTRVPRYAMPNSSLHPAFAALPSAHPARGVDDELRWGPISLRVCTTCFAPSGPREVTGTLPSLTAGIASYSRALCPRRARWPASHTFGALGATAASHAHTTLLGASGARRCGSLDCAPWSLRASSTRPRATAAAATRAPRGLWASCTCAPRRSARRRLPSVTAEPRVPPRIRRCPSGRRPDKRGARDERLDGRGRVAGRKRRQKGGAQAADRAWRERQLAPS